MKANISKTWSHDPSHFQFLRKTPVQHSWIPFVEERELPQFKDAALGAVAFFAFIGALIFLPEIVTIEAVARVFA